MVSLTQTRLVVSTPIVSTKYQEYLTPTRTRPFSVTPSPSCAVHDTPILAAIQHGETQATTLISSEGS